MSDPTWAVQKAIFGAVNGNVSWGGNNVPVYDAVPQNSAYPYISLDDQDVDEADYLASRKDERRFYLSVWSTYAGKKQVAEIMSTLDTLLHRKQFPLETGYMVKCFVVRKRTLRDLDKVTYQGLVTLRIITTH